MNAEIIRDSFRVYAEKSGIKITPSGIGYDDVCRLEAEMGIHLPIFSNVFSSGKV